jgi:hypothetical protein
MRFIKSIICILIQTACFGQTSVLAPMSLTLPNVAYIQLAPDNNSVVLVGSVSQAGGPILVSSNSTKWINFTSAVASGVTRTVKAQITAGSLPSGMSLKLTISPVSGSFGGSPGTNVSYIYLSNSQQIIIRDIGGAYTGQGILNGYNITYELVISDYSQLRSGSTSLSITFSIT